MTDPATPKPPVRYPKVRLAMHLIVANGPNTKEAKVTVLEMQQGLLLSIDKDGSGIGVQAVHLTLGEAAKLGEHLNLIRRRVIDRKPHLP